MVRVLITNDDGVSADGLHTLARCAREVFGEVTVVAPSHEMSGVSQGITLERPLRMTEVEPSVFAVSGTPADCVIVAMGTVFREAKPDLVLSGVNRGPNLGRDVFYSGTVAAAREGLFQGIPSVALSMVSPDFFPFERYAPVISHLLRWIAASPPPIDYLLNINLPVAGIDVNEHMDGLAGVPGIRGIRVTRLGQRFYDNEVIQRDDPRSKPYLWIGGSWPEMLDVEGTDCNAVRDGFVSVTPVSVDATHHAALDTLKPEV